VIPERAGRREWIGLAVIALPCLLYSMDLSVLNLAVPELSADLRPSGTELLWIVDIYGFFVAGALITMGTLGDRIGRRKLLMIGAAAFGAASVLAAFSTSAGMLIVARALLGLAGATLAPSTMSLIFTMFRDPQQRTVAIGVWIASYSAGAAVGPLLGGVMLEFFWWGSVFLLGVPVMALLLLVGPRLLPESRDEDAGRLDLPSAALSLAAVLLVVYGLKTAAQDGFAGEAIAAIALGAVVALVFVRRQLRLPNPLIDLDVFRRRAFSASLLTNMLGFFAAFGAFFFVAQYLQIVAGLSPLEAGLWSLPSSAGFVVGAMLGPVLLKRIRPGHLMALGLALGAAGFGVLTQTDGLAILVAGSVLFSLGLAPVAAVGTDLIVGSAPPEQAGAASGISETSAELGGALGIAVLGSVGAAVYRSQAEAGSPEGASAAARGTAGGAVAEAERLGNGLGGQVLAAAQDAFTEALQVTALVSAGLLAASSVLAWVLLRDARMGVVPEPVPA
jgi:DHA2 family multidrug resistance protein-like MFS transporter